MIPNYNNEAVLESRVRELIKNEICKNNEDIVLLESKKVVDILICKNGSSPKLFFIEVKYHVSKHGRLGFGSGNGVGFQPEIVSKKPDYFENNLMWVVASQDHMDTGILFLSSSTIRKYIAGGCVGRKYNNIQKKIFSEQQGYSEIELIKRIKEWIE